MGEAATTLRLSIADYLEMERSADTRHEYHQGEIFAMAGGTQRHSILGNAINTELNLICRNTGCIPFNGDMRIRIEAEDRFLYPEASVVCGPVQTSRQDKDAITNPILIAEVLSDSSEAYDRGEKFRLYRTLPSLREYVLIDQKQPLTEVFSLEADGTWRYQVCQGADAQVALHSLGATIAMRDLYRNVVWEA
ncbi:MAG: Uma2 family endonuclease [Bacteroidia bacterium]